MRLQRTCLVALVFAIVALVDDVRAQVADAYVVGDVEVDATAQTAAIARDIALADGQRKALVRLLRRLTLRSDHGRLPKVEDYAAVVQGIEILKERTSPARYMANIKINFKRDVIRGLLRAQAIPFSETMSKQLVVLPVYRSGGTLALWEDPNPWAKAWLGLSVDADAPVPLIVPTGTSADLRAIGPTQALEGDRVRLAAISSLYQATDVLVAYAELEIDLAANAERLQVSLRRYGVAGPQVVVESFPSKSRNSEAQLIAQAIARVVQQIEEGWKRDTLIRFEQERRLPVRIQITQLDQWLDIRKRLSEQSLVRWVEITSIATRAVLATLHYWGDASYLAIALSQSDLRLQESGGFWTLSVVQR